MNAVGPTPIVIDFPSTQSSEPGAQASLPAESALVQLCARVRNAQLEVRHFASVEPPHWEIESLGHAKLKALILCLADTPATTVAGQRAKALALRALLAENGESLYADAAAPDRLAWSLTNDILADERLTTTRASATR